MQLDGPDFDPHQLLDSSLAERRKRAFFALEGLRAMIYKDPSHFQSAQPTIRRSWPKILNWVRYFCFEATDAVLPSSSVSKEPDIASPLEVLTDLLAVLDRDNEALFNNSLINNEGFFEDVLKIWWNTDKSADTAPSTSCMAFACVCDSINFLEILRKRKVSSVDFAPVKESDIQATVLRVAKNDATGIAKRVIGYLTNPAHQEKEKYIYAFRTLRLINLLIIDTETPNNVSKFTTVFYQKQVGVHMMRHLDFILLDAKRESPVLTDWARDEAISKCFGIVARSLMIPGALHWTSMLFNHGFFRCIANLVGSSHFLTLDGRDLLTKAFTHLIPQLLVHREFLLTTIKAVKEVTADGSAKQIEASFLKDAWKTFSQIVLERTIFNALYERSCVDHFFEHRRCSNVGTGLSRKPFFSLTKHSVEPMKNGSTIN